MDKRKSYRLNIRNSYIDIGIDIKYLNTEGKNLFEIDNDYNESDITIYHKKNGKWNEYYEGNLDSPKGIVVVNGENGKFLSISPSTTLVGNNHSKTKIEFSDSDFDILKTEIDKSNSNTIITKVWYNGILQTRREFEIRK